MDPYGVISELYATNLEGIAVCKTLS